MEGCDYDIPFRSVLAGATSDPNRAYGPAVSLKCYLTKIGWQIDDHGRILSHQSRVVLLDAMSKSCIAELVQWDLQVAAKVSKRKDFHEWPEIVVGFPSI